MLKDHLLQGYTLNEKRLQAQVARLSELQAALEVMGRIIGVRQPGEPLMPRRKWFA